MFVVKKCGAVNKKVLIVLILVTIAIVGSLFTARQVRRSIISKMELDAGNTAYENKDWKNAYKHYQEYLGRNPKDVEILKKYAKAHLAVRPLEAKNILQAIGAYRNLLLLEPSNEEIYKELTKLYGGTGNIEELAYISQMEMDHFPDDIDAPAWRAEALINLKKTDEAREILTTLVSKLETQPDKKSEHSRACILLSHIAESSNTKDSTEQALTWLNKAVTFAPESVEALAARARFYRVTPDIKDFSSPAEQLAAARSDLEAADKIGTDNPQYLLFLAGEWIAYGELDKAAQELATADKLPKEKIEERFLDMNNWIAGRFLLASEIALKKGSITESVALAEQVLSVITEKAFRLRILPSVVRIYIASGDIPKAKQYLTEYSDTALTLQAEAATRQDLAYLKALIAKSENKPYEVINALPPEIMNDSTYTEMWSMLAGAYSQTDQDRRAANTLIQYLNIQPQDSAMLEQLAKVYLKLQDWSNALRTAQSAEKLNPTKGSIRLLRIEASINLAIQQEDTGRRTSLDNETKELAQLRIDNPKNTDIRILQAMTSLYLNDPNAAEKDLKLAIEDTNEPLKAEMQLCNLYSQTLPLPQAISYCRTVCDHYPEKTEAWLYLSNLYNSNKEYDQAVNCLKEAQKAVSDKTKNRSITLNLAVLEVLHGDRQAGIALLNELAAQDKQDIRTRILLLGIREIQEDQAKAQKLIEEVKNIEGQTGLMWRIYQSSIWLDSQDWRQKQQDISTYLQYCIDSDPKWSAPVLLMANLYEKMQDLRKAEDVCRQGLVRNPSAAAVADKLVTILENQGRYADAEKVLQQNELNSQFTKSRHTLLTLREGNYSNAIDELKLMVSNNVKDANSRILLAKLIYNQEKDAKKAFEYLDEAEAINPNSENLIATKAAILKAENKNDEALQVLDNYVKDNNNFASYRLRGEYYDTAGDFDHAEQDYRKLITFEGQGVAGYVQLITFYAKNNKLDKAVDTLEEGMKTYSQDSNLKKLLIKVLFQRNQGQDNQEALTMLAALEKELPHDTELMKWRAAQYFGENTPESIRKGSEKLREIIALEPTAVDEYLTLIRLAMQEGNYKEARDYVIQAIGYNPGNLPLVAARSKIELALGNTQMASDLADTVLQKDPNNNEAANVYMSAAINSKDRSLMDKAANYLKSAIEREPNNESLLISQARLLDAMNKTQDAVKTLEDYCKTDEGRKSVPALVTSADLYRLTGDMESANQKLDQAELVDPNNQMVIHSRFLWFVAQNKLDELSGISSKYLAAKNQNPRVLVDAAKILVSKNSMELKKEGLLLFEKAATLSPAMFDARIGLASTLYQTGEVERAKDAYNELLKQYPENIQVLNDLAWILQEHDHQYNEALKLANIGLTLKPDEPHLLDTRGTILSNIDDQLPNAKADFLKIIDLKSTDNNQKAQTLLKLGRLCVKLKEPDQAKQYLENALEIDKKINVFTQEEKTEINGIINGIVAQN